jgi:YidC/Oxa1 family membrane protein insertase
MDNKNVFIAVALSMSVLLFWSAFVDPPKPLEQNKIQTSENSNSKIKSEDNGITPNINEPVIEKKISREESIQKTNRIKLENNKVIGSISLEGGIIDDLSFKNYKESLDSDSQVTFLSP